MLVEATKLYNQGREQDATPIINKAAYMVRARLEDAHEFCNKGNGTEGLKVSRGICSALESCEALGIGSDTVLNVQTGLGEMLLGQSALAQCRWQRKELLNEAENVLRKPYQHYVDQGDGCNYINAQKCFGLLAGCLERQSKLHETEILLRSNISELERLRGPTDDTCLLRQLSLSSVLGQLCAQELASGRTSGSENKLSKCKEAELLIEWVVEGLKSRKDGPHSHLALAENTQARIKAAVSGRAKDSEGLGAVQFE
jgi:hypothetical protein